MPHKEKVIDVEAHAFFRMLGRGERFGLSHYETKERVYRTVRVGHPATRKHKSLHGITYYHYFNDNLSFYVICREKEFEKYIKSVIKTVIIERGRE